MAGRFTERHEVDLDDVERLMNCIVEHAGPDEGREAERLLALLTMLRASAAEHGETAITFTPPRGTGALADRALAAIARSDKHAERAARHRPRRSSGSAPGRRRLGDAEPRTAL
jgi:hypothetical protein